MFFLEISLVVWTLIIVIASPDELAQLLIICTYNFVLIFFWIIGLIEFPDYPTIQHGTLYWTSTDLCETLHLLFWLCLRWLAFMLWFILPTSPVIFTLDPPS